MAAAVKVGEYFGSDSSDDFAWVVSGLGSDAAAWRVAHHTLTDSGL